MHVSVYTSVHIHVDATGYMMPTVRIREETREALRELERHTSEGPSELLARAVDQLRRSLILAETNAAYGSLSADAGDWGEIREWDATLTDGLEDASAG